MGNARSEALPSSVDATPMMWQMSAQPMQLFSQSPPSEQPQQTGVDSPAASRIWVRLGGEGCHVDWYHAKYLYGPWKPYNYHVSITFSCYHPWQADPHNPRHHFLGVERSIDWKLAGSAQLSNPIKPRIGSVPRSLSLLLPPLPFTKSLSSLPMLPVQMFGTLGPVFICHTLAPAPPPPMSPAKESLGKKWRSLPSVLPAADTTTR